MADFSKESFDVPYVMIREQDPAIWSISTKHTPGLISGSNGCINNRAFVFRLKESDSSEFLLVFGVPNAVEAVQKLAREVNLPVKFVVSSGGAHHMFLDSWYAGFPKARILIPAQKIPDTRNGKELKATYASRWEQFNGVSFPPLEQYKDQVDFIIFNQLCIYRDVDGMTKNANSQGSAGPMGFMWLIMKQLMGGFSQPFDAVWFYVPNAKLICIEHNLDMYLSKEVISTLPFPMNWMMQPNTYALIGPKMNTKIRDIAVNAATWKYVLERCPFDTMTCLHREPGVVQKWGSTEAAREELYKIVHEAGEDDPTGARIYFNRRSKIKYVVVLGIVVAVASFFYSQNWT